MRFRFLHAADLHLDTPFTRLTGLSERIADHLRDASLRAFDRLVDTAIAEDVAFVVFAGDIYDGPERGVRAQLAFRDGCARLADAGIVTFVAYGNHDPLDEGWSAIAEFPDGVHIFGSDTVETHEVTVDGILAATVSGISYAVADTTDNLSTRFGEPSGRGFHVAVLHANVGGHADYAAYSPCTLDDLRSRGYDYWALGHIHKRSELGDGHPLVVYPGNLQGRSPKPSERGPKGAVIVEVDDNVATTRFVALDSVRFDHVEVDIDGLSLDGLETALVDASAQARTVAGDRPVIRRGLITGRGELHDEMAGAERREELLYRLRDLARHSEPFLWWDDLTWRTGPEIDVTERAGGDDFVGDLLRQASTSGPRAAWVPGLGVEYRTWLGDRVPTADDPELFDEAVTTALVALLEEH